LTTNADNTSFEKKLIIDAFLNNRGVKKFIYELLNKKNEEGNKELSTER